MSKKKELSTEELRAQGFEREDVSNPVNLGIMVAITVVVGFVAASAVAVWMFIAVSQTNTINGRLETKKTAQSSLADGQMNALLAKSYLQEKFGKTFSLEVSTAGSFKKGIKLGKGAGFDGSASAKRLPNCRKGSGVICDTVRYRRNQKALVLHGGQDPYHKNEVVLPIKEGMTRLLSSKKYVQGLASQKK